MSRVLRLTLLAPDIVEAILDGRQPEGITLSGLMEPFPVRWDQQRIHAHRQNFPGIVQSSPCPTDPAGKSCCEAVSRMALLGGPML
jgi:hypothetical protein